MEERPIPAPLLPYLPEIARLCKEAGISKLYAFGSVVRDDFGPDSDIDLLYRFEQEASDGQFHRFMDFYDHVKELTGREVDLVPARYVQNPYLISELNKTAVRIYG